MAEPGELVGPYGLEGPLENLVGGSLVGNTLAAVAFGALNVQTARYFAVFPSDIVTTKLLVSFLWITNALQLASFTWATYYWLCRDWGSYTHFINSPWQFTFHQTSICIASVSVETFFARRVYSLSGNRYLGILLMSAALTQFSFGQASSIMAYRHPNFPNFLKQYNWLVLTWLALQAAADALIAGTMAYLLWKMRTGVGRTDRAIHWLILNTINSGLFTATISVVTLGFFARSGFHFVLFCLGGPLPGIYTITLLSILHTRRSTRDRLYPSDGVYTMGWEMSIFKRDAVIDEAPKQE